MSAKRASTRDLEKITLGTFYSPDEKSRARAELKHRRVMSGMSATAKAELRDMRAQLRDFPGDEPEPTGRFDRITEDERHAIARELNL